MTDKATKFLTELLQDGPLPAAEVQQMAEEFEISTSALIKAKQSLRLISTKEKQESGRWFWELPPNLIKPAPREEPKPTWMTTSNCIRCDKSFPLEQTRYHTDGTLIRGYCPPCQELIRAENRRALSERLRELYRARDEMDIDRRHPDPRLAQLNRAIEQLEARGIHVPDNEQGVPQQ